MDLDTGTGSNTESVASPAAEREMFQAPAGPSGIGGWLFLVAIGLLIAPVRQFIVVLQTMEMIGTEEWTALTTPGSAGYYPGLFALVVGELIANVTFVAAGITLLVLLKRHSRLFPRGYILLTTLNLLFILGDAIIAGRIAADAGLDAESSSELGRAILGAAIWVPYMLKSRRVKNTFTE